MTAETDALTWMRENETMLRDALARYQDRMEDKAATIRGWTGLTCAEGAVAAQLAQQGGNAAGATTELHKILNRARWEKAIAAGAIPEVAFDGDGWYLSVDGPEHGEGADSDQFYKTEAEAEAAKQRILAEAAA